MNRCAFSFPCAKMYMLIGVDEGTCSGNLVRSSAGTTLVVLWEFARYWRRIVYNSSFHFPTVKIDLRNGFKEISASELSCDHIGWWCKCNISYRGAPCTVWFHFHSTDGGPLFDTTRCGIPCVEKILSTVALDECCCCGWFRFSLEATV